MTPPVLYVAGPMGAPNVLAGNVARAVAVADLLLDMGAAVILPHLFAYLPDRPYEQWMRVDLALLARCDAVVRLPGESPGADREVARAGELGLLVLHGLAAVEEWMKQRNITEAA